MNACTYMTHRIYTEALMPNNSGNTMEMEKRKRE